MNILVLISFYPPLGSSGHHARCQDMVSALAKRGHRMQVLTSNYRLPPTGLSEDRGIFRELMLYPCADQLARGTVPYRQIYAHEHSNLAALHYRLMRFKPDVVYVWDMSGLSKSMLFSLQDQGIPIVYDIHSRWLYSDEFTSDPWLWWWQTNTKLFARWRKFRMSLFGGVRRLLREIPARNRDELDLTNAMVVSQNLRDGLVSDSLRQLESSTVQHPAFRVDDATRKKHYKKSSHFVWAGRLSERKAPDIALRAVEILREQGIRISLDIYAIGEPIERKMMRAEIDRLCLGDQVKMIGIRPGELSSRYAKYDALLFTSRGDDPFPITPLEAMRSGLPCILSKDGGIQEIVEDGETALLFERDSPEALVATILRFLALPDAGKTLADRCIDSLHASHSIDRYIDIVESTMASAIQRAS